MHVDNVDTPDVSEIIHLISQILAVFHPLMAQAAALIQSTPIHL